MLSPNYQMELDKKINLLRRIARYHENLAVFRQAVARILGRYLSGERESAAELFSHFARESIDDHFAYEESIVFPVVLHCGEVTAGLVGQLIQEHGIMRGLRFSISDKLSVTASPPASVEIVKTDLIRLFALLEKHIVKEIKFIVPFFTGNESANFLLGRKQVTVESDKKSSADMPRSVSNASGDAKPAAPAPSTGNDDIYLRLLPKIERVDSRHFRAEEGYEVEILQGNTIRYVDSTIQIDCPYQRLSNGECVVSDDDLLSAYPAKARTAKSEIARIIIVARINGCLKKYCETDPG